MPAKLFAELGEEKREKILRAGLAEFAVYGYENGSTNRIVKAAGISKGSLFQYFASKEELYFFLLDRVTAEFAAAMEEGAANLPADLFQRVIGYASLEFSWYMQNPEKAGLLIGAFAKSGDELSRRIAERYEKRGQTVYDKLLGELDESRFPADREKTAALLNWILKGFNEEFAKTARLEQRSMRELRDEYIERLTGYMELLRHSLLA